MTPDPQVRTKSSLPEEVAVALARGAIILTPNQRAAHTLRQAFDRAALERGETLWQMPAIFAFDSWLARQWTDLLISGEEDRLLLNRSQEHQLWRTILAADKELSGLQTLDSLAMLAAEGWERLWSYGGRPQLQHAAITPDTQAFARWAAEFDSVCLHRRYLSGAALPAALTAAVAEGLLHLPGAGVALVDFLQSPPAHSQLFEALGQAGFPVASLSTALLDATEELYIAADDLGELRAAAQWLWSTNLACPSARLALVVPNLAERGADIERALSDACGSSHSETERAPTYEFSLGQSLAETAAGCCALMLLRWTQGPLSIDSISRLLLSPFFGATDPVISATAAEFDAFELRRSKLLRPELTLNQCVQAMERSRRRAGLAPLLARMKHAGKHSLDLDAVDSPAHWADAFRAVLKAFGWAEATDRNSLSYQVRQRWESALDELSTLNFDNALVSAATALDMLSRIATQTIFAPESQGAPVQVLGPLELGGAAFDGLWFVGADDAGWPLPISPHPLLPWPLQHAFGMPGSSLERDAEAGRALTQSVTGSAARVIFSYAQNGEDRVRRPSPLLAGHLFQPFLPAVSPAQQALPLQIYEEYESLPSLPDRILHGGARILELQAACAFRAFAEMRLFSTEPESPAHGFDARESGTVIHHVMQHFWGLASSQQKLRAMPVDARHQLLRESIETALERPLKNAQTRWDRAYLEVQRRRLFDLLKPWLNVELARPPFEVRVREESVDDASIGPLRLKLRVDRVDDTAGGPVVIDYKSGRASYKDWSGDRPDAPQLPLYGVLTEGERLGGLAFAVLRAGKGLTFEGVAKGSTVLLRPKTLEENTMLGQVGRWRSVLESLAYSFANGTAEVLPKEYPFTCHHCSQRLLCRLDVAAFADSDDGEKPEPLEKVGRT